MIFTPDQLVEAIPHNTRCQAAMDAGHIPWPLDGNMPWIEQKDHTWQRAAMCPRCGKRSVVSSQTPGGDETLVIGKAAP